MNRLPKEFEGVGVLPFCETLRISQKTLWLLQSTGKLTDFVRWNMRMSGIDPDKFVANEPCFVSERARTEFLEKCHEIERANALSRLEKKFKGEK